MEVGRKFSVFSFVVVVVVVVTKSQRNFILDYYIQRIHKDGDLLLFIYVHLN